MTNAMADSLLQYLTDKDKVGETDEAFTQWAKRYQTPISISDYMEAREMIRSYKAKKISSKMMRACFSSIREVAVQV